MFDITDVDVFWKPFLQIPGVFGYAKAPQGVIPKARTVRLTGELAETRPEMMIVYKIAKLSGIPACEVRNIRNPPANGS